MPYLSFDYHINRMHRRPQMKLYSGGEQATKGIARISMLRGRAIPLSITALVGGIKLIIGKYDGI